MSKKPSLKLTKKNLFPGFVFVSSAAGVEEYLLKSNGLRVLYFHRPDTGVITTNITYLVGARDEARGETGLAHMLEHMLFKPTTFDVAKGVMSGGAMQFERETGCILNANTWTDRTTYFFNYPTEYFTTALRIEAERMVGTILTDKELKPEQGNVLSEFDMYNGDPYFALDVQMVSAAFQSHPYGHETIGFREDIEDYNAEKLGRFYRNYYRPDNAIMMVIGDVDLETALKSVKKEFSSIEKPSSPIPRFSIREPKQEGLRRVEIERNSSTNVVSIGFKSAPFPSKEWFTVGIMSDVLTMGPESILHKLLVDTGKASSVTGSVGPCSEEYLVQIIITLAPGQNHREIEELTLNEIRTLTSKTITSLVKKVKAKMVTDELFGRSRSLSIAQELTEYVASGNWEMYAKTPEMLANITVKEVVDCVKKSFTNTQMTIGYFKGIS
jgi:zinc protease